MVKEIGAGVGNEVLSAVWEGGRALDRVVASVSVRRILLAH